MAAQAAGPYIAMMDFESLWQDAAGLIADMPQTGLLMFAVGAMAIGVLGSLLIRPVPVLGRLLRGASTLALVGILVAVVLQMSRIDPRFDLAVPELGLPRQTVEGGETRIPLSRDGHFWLEANVDGTPARFLVDTGATLTALSIDTAAAAGLTPRRGGIPVQLQTANGSVAAHLTAIDELRFGNVVARGLDAVIAPNLGQTNVIGMNLLSRLASWRVEGRTMILVPNNPQPPLGDSGS